MVFSFHWATFDRATSEFHRMLRSGGYFFAIWNPHTIEGAPTLLEIEEQIKKITPDIERILSERRGIKGKLSDKLSAFYLLEDVIYMEGATSCR